MVDTELSRARQDSAANGSSIPGDVPPLFTTGDRVHTPKGSGVIVYRRMKPPTFLVAEAYSVKLDDLGHVGAIFAAGDVSTEEAQT